MMKFSYLTILLFLYTCSFSQTPVGIFENGADIGKPKLAGSSQYDELSQTYTIKGGGYNIWFNRDEFHYLYKKISGDFILTADFAFAKTGGNGHKKIGWMIRETLDDQAASINACAHEDGLIALQWRPLRGTFMRDPEDEIFFSKKYFQTIQLERIGKKVTMSIAHLGEPLQVVGSHEMSDMRDSVFAGLYICSHDSTQVEEARVWNVRIDRPVANTYHPNPIVQRTLKPIDGVVGCRLETMNVFDGKRKVIRESTGRFEAPNWMPDGKSLLYNENGSLFKIPVEGGDPEQINTGTATRNNNDHGISFDGKMLAISSHRDGLPGGGSTVYVLPLTGGTPKLLTEKTPSYWHGWNPNGKDVLVIGQRNDSRIYNIIKVPVNGGPEVMLTNNTTGHVDGSEYSPDGKFIYYNANASGTMQIWRMKPDGTAREQLRSMNITIGFHISPRMGNGWS